MSWIEKLPEDHESERSLLATLCAPGNDREAAECALALAEEDFITPSHKAVFKALETLLDRREEVNAITLRGVLEAQGNLNRVGDYAGLLELLSAEEVGRPMVLVEILKECTRRRALIRMGAEMVKQASDASAGTSEIVESCCQSLAAMTQATGETGPQAVGDLTDDVISRVLAEAQGQKFGTRTGFYRFDGMTHGFQPGQLVILAARPGIGKSTLAMNWLLRSSGFGNQGAGMFFSLEMSREEVTRKLLSDLACVNLREFSLGDAARYQALQEAKSELDERPIWIDDRSETTVRQIRAKVERQQSRDKVGLVIVDYLQLITSPAESRRANEAVRIGEITRGLKLLAKDCRVPVILLSQLNRELEKRGAAARPQLSDLRDSGSIEQDADIVAFIHRKGEDVGAELVIAKHRNGPQGVIPMTFRGEFSRYEEIQRETRSPQAEPENEFLEYAG